MNILLGLTGSVATTVSQKLIAELSLIGTVKVVHTQAAVHFDKEKKFAGNKFILGEDLAYDFAGDKHEWSAYQHRGEVFHIECRKWADVFVIAPMSSNTLGKIANGISDNLLTCVAQAWDFTKPILIAPAMNTCMFTNPTTQKNLKTLMDMGYVLIPPVRKVLACGDDGIGAMAQIEDIKQTVIKTTIPWYQPISNIVGIPIGKHPGAFGVQRKHDFHTGVDLYCNEGDKVHSCTNGIVVETKPFTGPSIGHTWWNETYAVVIDTGRNYILYGELNPSVKAGDKINAGDVIGKIIPVLGQHKHRPDIPGHSVNMLHLELLRRNPVFTEFQGRNGFMTWDLDKCQPYDLFDPTRELIKIYGKTLDYPK